MPSQLFDDTPAAAELVMPLKGRRVGVYKQLFEDASPEVVSACRNAVDLLREHGCEASRPYKCGVSHVYVWQIRSSCSVVGKDALQISFVGRYLTLAYLFVLLLSCLALFVLV